jgi:hypothetical protein
MSKTTRDPSVCLRCWELWVKSGAKKKDMPRPLERRDTWQERVEWKNMGDQTSRLAVIQVAIYCREHGMERVDETRGVFHMNQETLL